jgi:hypothetical protein
MYIKKCILIKALILVSAMQSIDAMHIPSDKKIVTSALAVLVGSGVGLYYRHNILLSALSYCVSICGGGYVGYQLGYLVADVSLEVKYKKALEGIENDFKNLGKSYIQDGTIFTQSRLDNLKKRNWESNLAKSIFHKDQNIDLDVEAL